ncbi:ADAM 17-like protease isoform X2 [Coccinella septempunctata]|uniref:ADAM 17-like protease isoform X2 n=1 Tax=Coccinella septempunctata TaxID=41139 RepID=UPI001D0893C3|nr:ADAM 17-like protease isoform X2 [Coccinella septempunctata]
MLIFDNILLLAVIFFSLDNETQANLQKNLKYFEKIHANDLIHNVVKKGLKETNHPFNKIREVHVNTHGKKFRLILSPKQEILHSKFKAYEVDGSGKEKTVRIDTQSFYEGRVFGERQSHVKMHIDDGILTGTIHLPDEEEVYHIEPLWRHEQDSDNRSMIAYKQSDVNYSWNHPSIEFPKGPRMCGYVKEGSITDRGEELQEYKLRQKRQIDGYEYTPRKTRCPLLLVADYRFFQEMGGSNTKTTINYLISLIDRVHKIYNDTIWQDRQEVDGFKGMGFVIKKIVVHSEPTRTKAGEAHYNMVRDKWDVRNLLEKFSPCSLRSIRKVLQAKSGKCFSEPEESFCGNLRVEGDEECDAGLLGTEDNDQCCDKDCKLRPRAVCSDKNSPCCQHCQFMRAGAKCREAQYATCEQESLCTGHQAECPKSPPMADNTDCQERGKCKDGKCIPYCETQGLQSCMCDIIENACKRCCRSNINETCTPIDGADILADGSPCIQGFCNNGHCEKTIQDVVERFWDIIEDININKVLLFLRDNIIGTTVLISAILWIPAGCIINFFDRRKKRERVERWEWRTSEDFLHPNEVERIIHLTLRK